MLARLGGFTGDDGDNGVGSKQRTALTPSGPEDVDLAVATDLCGISENERDLHGSLPYRSAGTNSTGAVNDEPFAVFGSGGTIFGPGVLSWVAVGAAGTLVRSFTISPYLSGHECQPWYSSARLVCVLMGT